MEQTLHNSNYHLSLGRGQGGRGGGDSGWGRSGRGDYVGRGHGRYNDAPLLANVVTKEDRTSSHKHREQEQPIQQTHMFSQQFK